MNYAETWQRARNAVAERLLARSAITAVITEIDTSGRTAVHNQRSGRFTATHHMGPPVYKRRYLFPEPIRGQMASYYSFDPEFPPLKKSETALVTLRDYVVDTMKPEIAAASLTRRTLDVMLRGREVDEQWQASPPLEFYDQLAQFYRSKYPYVTACTVVSAHELR